MFRWRLRLKRNRRTRTAPTLHYRTHKEAARTLIEERLRVHTVALGVTFKRIAIRDTKRSWGSCSSKGNLNFSYKLLFLPPCLREYIIIHELCHLRELNHSARFWAEVEAIMPDARARAHTLRLLERTQGTRPTTLRKYAEEHQCAVCSALEENGTSVFMPPQSK